MGCALICNGAFDKMPETVELVMVSEICEDLIGSVNDVVGIEISVGKLRITNDIDRTIRSFFQFRIGMNRETVRYCFDPLVEVTVLKNKTVEFVVFSVFSFIRKNGETSVGEFGSFEFAALFLHAFI